MMAMVVIAGTSVMGINNGSNSPGSGNKPQSAATDVRVRNEAGAVLSKTVVPVVALDKASLIMNVGETHRLAAMVRDSRSPVMWASSNPGFATVGPDGVVSAIHEGSLMITATLSDEAAVDECRVTVVDPKTAIVAQEISREITGIIIGNEIQEMVVGDDLGIVATCLPYKWFESNPYTLETSNPNILKVSRANIVTAVGAGKVTLTARTPNGHTDRITFEVKPFVPEALSPPEKTYQVELSKFGVVLDEVSQEQARKNSLGVNQIILYAQRWGYQSVVFPRGLYLLDPAEPISMRSNLRVDLNGSTWQILPNPYTRYALIRFEEMNGPNLFKNYDVMAETVTQPSLTPDPVSKFTVREGDTSVQSLPIPVGAWPEKQADDQLIRTLEKGSTCFVSTPIGVNKVTMDDGKASNMVVRLNLNYYSNSTFVASKDLGAIWLRDTAAKKWCDRGGLMSFRLGPGADYNNIKLELRFSLKNCQADIFMDKAVVCREITTVLENSKLCNGTILGERDFKEPLYPNWKKTPATEGGIAIKFETGVNNGIEALTVRKSIGFNISSRLGQSSSGTVGIGIIPLQTTNLEWGDFDEGGGRKEASTVQRTINYLDLSAIKDSFELGLPLGYMGYNTLRVRVYDIYFYDTDKVFLERQRGRLSYRKYQKPRNAAWAKLVLHWDAPIAGGHRDFAYAIGFLTNYKPPLRNYIRNCVIEDNFSCGFAACGGINWRIEGNIFRRNGGRMPGCDIDWEDGWEYSQDDVVRNNRFESGNGLILCAGLNHVFKNNLHTGNLNVYNRTQAMKFEGNIFGVEGKTIRATFGTQTDAYVIDNKFLGGTVKFEKEHREKGKYQFYWQDNILTNTKFNAR